MQIDPKQVKSTIQEGVTCLYPNIEAERARKSMSRIQLANYLGVSESTMKNWMHGKTEIPASKLIKMANFFGCTTDYLLGLETA